MFNYNKSFLEKTAVKSGFQRDNLEKIFRLIDILNFLVGSKNRISLPINFSSIDAISFYNIRTKLTPVLKKGDQFNFEFAKNEVIEYLISLISLNDNEKLFIDNFYKGFYTPELLFEDEDIINRIKEHPMAIWKTSNFRINK